MRGIVTAAQNRARRKNGTMNFTSNFGIRFSPDSMNDSLALPGTPGVRQAGDGIRFMRTTGHRDGRAHRTAARFIEDSR